MKQQPPKLTWGTRLWVFIQGVGLTLLIPIEAIVMGVVAWRVFKNTDAFQYAWEAFLVLGVMALAVDRCMYRAQLKLAMIERDVAREQLARMQPQPVSNEA